MIKMKKLNILLICFLLIGLTSAGLLSSLARTETSIDLDKKSQDILEERELSNPIISDLICDGSNCRSCAKRESDGYGMGCVSIPQTYCSNYEEVCPENVNESCYKVCINWIDYSISQLEELESEAYKKEWENIADVIVEREGKVIEIKLEKSEVSLIEKTIEILEEK